MAYKFAIGHVDPTTMTDVTPQPKSEGIITGVEKELGDGSIVEDGYSTTEWEFTALTETELHDLLTDFNLLSYKSYNCTISTRNNEQRTFTNFYARVIKPTFTKQGNFQMGLWRGIVFRFTRLDDASIT